MAWVIGIVLAVVGMAGLTNALGVVGRVARIWPREYRRGDAGMFSSASFLIRFVSLMVLAAGIAVIWLAAFGAD